MLPVRAHHESQHVKNIGQRKRGQQKMKWPITFSLAASNHRENMYFDRQPRRIAACASTSSWSVAKLCASLLCPPTKILSQKFPIGWNLTYNYLS